ncbi:unnamed protein product [Ostreobium quekettii]|uniref:Uncharacterized protein n=1 Tax=Ostreobium quekettii TaxID=121088 RepID=A0A8S1IYX1_9CHLO|nr:unnamed protein product [Ostreobium quekettii]
MDKTQAFRLALRRKGLGLGMAEAELLRLTSAAILKPIAGKSAFSKAAAQVAENIEEVKSFVRKHKREYTQQGIGCAADRIEQEVGLFVKACSARIEQLNKIVATELQEGRAVNHQKGNEQTMAHCLGVSRSSY